MTKVASPPSVWQQYYRAGFIPIPICGPDCKRVNTRTGEVCQSPGKTPHVKGWPELASDSTDERTLAPLFRDKSANTGIALQRHQITMDIDPRNGGRESWERLLNILAFTPDTPHAFTGGGGDHHYFDLPYPMDLPAGGSLAEVGYPGVEWKTKGGQVVAPPSRHVSGGLYEWEYGQEPWNTAVQVIPEGVLNLVIQAANKIRESVPGKPVQPFNGKAKYTREQVFQTFEAIYHEGDRRGSLGLPRVIGHLRSKRVCVECAVTFLLWWQHYHFAPPLADREVERHVRDMYARYEHPKEACPHGRNHPFINDLHRRLVIQPHRHAGHPGPSAANLATPDADNVVDFEAAKKEIQSRSKRERAEDRNTKLYNARGRFTAVKLQKQERNAELYPYTSDIGVQLGISGTASPLLMHNPERYVGKERLEESLRELEGEESKLAENVHHCGWDGALVCDNGHGERMRSKTTCKYPFHAMCPSQVGEKVRQVELPDLAGDETYREIWMQMHVPITGIYPDDNQGMFKSQLERFQKEITKLSHRKALKGHILSRAASWWLARPMSVMFIKFMVRDKAGARGDIAIAHLKKTLGAVLLADWRYQSGEQALLQLYEDSFSTLAGMKDPTDYNLFGAYYYGVKGLHVFQGMGTFWENLKEVEKEEPPKCDICGDTLRLKVIDPALERPKEAVNAGHAPPIPPPPRQGRFS